MKNKILLCFLIFSFRSFCQITPEWVTVNDSTSALNYYQWQMKVSPAGNVYVSGSTWDTTAFFNVLLKYDANGNLIWSQTYDSLTTYTGDVAIDNFENIYITGRHLKNNYYEYLTLKYDSAGNLLWSASYSNYLGGWAYDMPFAIAVDDSGNVYVTGQSPGPNGLNDDDIATIKYNSGGVEQWVRRYNYQNMFDRAYDLIVDSLQNVFITGMTMDSLTNEYILTLKYDSLGNLLWSSRFTEDTYDVGQFIKLDKAGFIFTGGITGGNADDRYKLLKYDNNGNFIWEAEYDIPGTHEVPSDMIIDAYSNIYMTGTQIAWSGSYDDYATVKFDSTGQIKWIKTYNAGPAYDDAMAIIEDAAGNILVTGKSFLNNNSAYDYYTIKYDTAGNQIWTARYDTGPFNTWDEANSIALDAAGNIYVSGNSSDSLGTYKILTLKYSFTTGILENIFSNQLNIFPNPATTEFQISNYEFQTSDEITLTDVLGKTVFTNTIKAPTSSFKLQTSNFSNGIYFLQLKTKDGMVSKKVVVQH